MNKPSQNDQANVEETDNETEMMSLPAGVLIEKSNIRAQHAARHRANLLKNATRLSTDCGWAVSIVAVPPENITNKSKSLEIAFKDKNGRDPPANTKLNKVLVTEKPVHIDRGIQFYREISDDFEKTLTPTKVRTSTSRNALDESSYISPMGTTVLNLNIGDLQNSLSSLPTGNIEEMDENYTATNPVSIANPASITNPASGTNNSFTTSALSISTTAMHIHTCSTPGVLVAMTSVPPVTVDRMQDDINSAMAQPDTSVHTDNETVSDGDRLHVLIPDTFQPPSEHSNSQHSSDQLVEHDSDWPVENHSNLNEMINGSQSKKMFSTPFSIANVQPQTSTLSAVIERCIINNESNDTDIGINIIVEEDHETLGERNCDDYNSNETLNNAFRSVAKVIEPKNPLKRSLDFPALHPITILGSQAKRTVTVEKVKFRLPAPSCSVCNVEKMTKEDIACRLVNSCLKIII